MDSYKQTFLEQDSEMKPNLTSDKKKKRKRIPKEIGESKSKDKQIMSDKPKKGSGKGKKTKLCDIYKDAEDQYMSLERAAIFLERLDEGLPKFAKCMLPSNVLYSFWLILPRKFCVMHLPDSDTTVTLVDESGKEFKTNYLLARHGLSAGWRGFTTAQRLLQGDILFFRLVQPCKLQVNIVRRYGLEAIEAAVCLMEMHPRVKRKRGPTDFEKAGEAKREKLKHKEVKEEEECELEIQAPTKAGEDIKEELKHKEVKEEEECELKNQFMVKGREDTKEELIHNEITEEECELKNQTPGKVGKVKKGKLKHKSVKEGGTKKGKLQLKEVKEEQCEQQKQTPVKATGGAKKGKTNQKEVKEEECELNNQTPVPVQTNKGKRTRRSPKKFIARFTLDLCSTQRNGEEDSEIQRVSCAAQCDNSDGPSSEVVQGSTSEITNQSQPDEVGSFKLNLDYHESNINCHTTAERIFHSSTVAT
uniref:uncharacterized protein LOC122592429 isoform X2 n=1 Tax=Erigeron canadensis TaxID=72917 RepID=UPI001CB98A1E|nr:uncharacterized protein LOC122592429 isoform X2 [Erigeron canadensis]